LAKVVKTEKMKDGESEKYIVELWAKYRPGPIRDVIIGYVLRAYEYRLSFS
jgi:hypothetical protein